MASPRKITKKRGPLGSLSEDEVAILLSTATSRELSSGEILFQEGDSGSSVFILRKGKVELRSGGKSIAVLQEEAVIGELAFLDPAPRSTTAKALSKSTVFELSREPILKMLKQGEPAAIKLLQTLTLLMCMRLETVNQLVRDEVVRPKANFFGRLWQKYFSKRSGD